ncbi:sensor domain-containing protein [Pararhodospirillum oryzae]|uniref:Diguanylate cyclase n=1 Tax=Pararhodospirillum oryzae TaxID=478448 RepID=A0A512HBU2_9PROT|nr:PAS domain S-box protein [Pararhodospirillum oryzae]GEO82860.1 hypothetical protein ROR02_29910 [Pararhodospirillum oryzae]
MSATQQTITPEAMAPLSSPVVREVVADLVSTMPGVLVCVCRDGLIVTVNEPGQCLLAGGKGTPGRDPAVIGRPFHDFLSPPYTTVIDSRLEVLLEEPTGLTLPLRCLDGSTLHLVVQARAARDEDGAPLVVLLGRDIRKQIKGVNALLAQQNRLARMVDLSFDLICLLRGSTITFLNRAGARMLGAPGGEALGRAFADFVCSDYRALFDEGLDRMLQEDELVPVRLQALGGQRLDVEMRVTRFREEAGECTMIEARDITARQQAAEGVRMREARLVGILAHVGEAVLTVGRDGLIASFNLAAERIFGVAAARVVGTDVETVLPGFTADFLRGGALAEGSTERQGRRPDGQAVPLALAVSRLVQGRDTVFVLVARDITGQKEAQEREQRHARELEARVEARTRDLRHVMRQNERILEAAGDGILGVDGIGRVRFANRAAGRLLGMDPSLLVGRALDEILLRADSGEAPPRALFDARMVGPGGEGFQEVMVVRHEGAPFPAEVARTALDDDDQAPAGWVVVVRDVSERHKAQAHLRLSNALFKNAAEGFAVCDRRGILHLVNPAFAEITGIEASALKDRSVADFLFGETLLLDSLLAAIEAGCRWDQELWSKRPDGSDYAVRVAGAPLPTSSPDEDGYAALILTDVTQRKRDEERIRHQANYDSLTALANRALFHDRLANAVAVALRSGWVLALLYIDLDGFKRINDTLGHAAGDQVLSETARRLLACARDSDTVARLGGDEFTLILTDLVDADDAQRVAQRVLVSLAAPFDVKGQVARISASVGIALLPMHALDAEHLLSRADKAMYQAKRAGKNTWRFPSGDEIPLPLPHDEDVLFLEEGRDPD